MVRFIFLLAGFFLLFGAPLISQKDIFKNGNDAYNEKNYSKAIEYYQELISQEYVSPDLYLNLGNSYLQTNQIGRAVLSFEKGIKLDQSHKPLIQNLEYANKLVSTQITLIPDFFLVRYWYRIVHSLSSSAWSFVQILLGLLMLISLWLWLMGSHLNSKRNGFIGLISGTVFLILGLVMGSQKLKYETTNTHAIVSAASAELLTTASQTSDLKTTLSEGVKVKLLDTIGDFYKVELLDKEIGWIEKSLILLI